MQNGGGGVGRDKQDVLWELESSEYQVYLNSLPRHGFPYLYLIRGHKIIKKCVLGFLKVFHQITSSTAKNKNDLIKRIKFLVLIVKSEKKALRSWNRNINNKKEDNSVSIVSNE